MLDQRHLGIKIHPNIGLSKGENIQKDAGKKGNKGFVSLCTTSEILLRCFLHESPVPSFCLF